MLVTQDCGSKFARAHQVTDAACPSQENRKFLRDTWAGDPWQRPCLVIFFFPYNPPPPPYPDKPPARPTPKSLISVHFGSVWLRFGSVWLRSGPFRVCFGSVSGPFGGVGWWGRGGVGERGFCKGKEYHYPCLPQQGTLQKARIRKVLFSVVICCRGFDILRRACSLKTARVY